MKFKYLFFIDSVMARLLFLRWTKTDHLAIVVTRRIHRPVLRNAGIILIPSQTATTGSTDGFRFELLPELTR